MSRFDHQEQREGTYCTQWDYTIDRFGNEDVLPFSISDMDFSMPESTKQILHERVEHGIFGYTRWCHEDFQNAVANWYEKRFDFQVNCAQLTYSPTVIYSLAELLRLISAKVLVFTPAYDAFFGVIKENNCIEYNSELIIENDHYVIDKLDFENQIKKVDTLLFCSPHNPVGKVFTNEELEYIIEMCIENDVYIISDEIHMDICFQKQHIPLMKVAEKYEYEHNVAIITSATKSFNFPGLLFSYALIGNRELKAQFEYNLKVKNGLSSCTTLGLLATIDVYTNGHSWLDDLKVYLYDNYLYVLKYFEEHQLKLKLYQFEGTYLLWIDASYYTESFHKLKEIMYEQEKVGIMDGRVYKSPNFLRINIGCSRLKLAEGIRRLHMSIQKLEKID